MRILLDENLPRGLRTALAEEGHEVESVHSKHLDGIANGALYELAQREYDLLFTRDDEFSRRARDKKTASSLKAGRKALPRRSSNCSTINPGASIGMIKKHERRESATKNYGARCKCSTERPWPGSIVSSTNFQTSSISGLICDHR